MTKLSYTITTPTNKVIKANTYADALRIMGENPGSKKVATYELIPEDKPVISEKRKAIRLKIS